MLEEISRPAKWSLAQKNQKGVICQPTNPGLPKVPWEGSQRRHLPWHVQTVSVDHLPCIRLWLAYTEPRSSRRG